MDHTFWLTLIFVAVTVAMFGLGRAGATEFDDPVCGMRLERRHIAVTRPTATDTAYLCSPACAEVYDREHYAESTQRSPDALGLQPG